jgi:hypothetical protein
MDEAYTHGFVVLGQVCAYRATHDRAAAPSRCQAANVAHHRDQSDLQKTTPLHLFDPRNCRGVDDGNGDWCIQLSPDGVPIGLRNSSGCALPRLLGIS